MRINFFTPLPDQPTDIANMSAALLPELAALAEVRVWTDQQKWAAQLDQQLDIRHLNPVSPPYDVLNWADINVYNLGNNARFHRGIFDLARQLPGFVILHDVRLAHFFANYAERPGPDRDFWVEEMRRAGFGNEAEGFVSGALPFSAFSDLTAMTETALRPALAGILHNRDEYEALQRNDGPPTFFLPLCLSRQPRPAPKWHILKRSGRGPIRLIVFGFIGSNRCLPQVLHALAAMPQNTRFRLDIFGLIEEPGAVSALIEELGLTRTVQAHGFVSDAVLDDALARADLAINLRYPTMGEASGSQLRIWENALPSVVTDIGWYGSLPPDAVIHVSAGNEVAELAKVFAAIRAHRSAFVEYGRRGREVLERDHLPSSYARGLLDILAQHEAISAEYTTLAMARRAAVAASEVGGLRPQYTALIAQRIAEIGVMPVTR